MKQISKEQQYIPRYTSDPIDYAAQLAKDVDDCTIVTKELEGDGYWKRR